MPSILPGATFDGYGEWGDVPLIIKTDITGAIVRAITRLPSAALSEDRGSVYRITYSAFKPGETANGATFVVIMTVVERTTPLKVVVQDQTYIRGSVFKEPDVLPPLPSFYVDGDWGEGKFYNESGAEIPASSINTLNPNAKFSLKYSKSNVLRGYEQSTSTYEIVYTVKVATANPINTTVDQGDVWNVTDEVPSVANTNLQPVPTGYSNWQAPTFRKFVGGKWLTSSAAELPNLSSDVTKIEVLFTAPVAPGYVGLTSTWKIVYKVKHNLIAASPLVQTGVPGEYRFGEDVPQPELPDLPAGYQAWGAGVLSDSKGNPLTAEQVKTLAVGTTFSLTFRASVDAAHEGEDSLYTISYRVLARVVPTYNEGEFRTWVMGSPVPAIPTSIAADVPEGYMDWQPGVYKLWNAASARWQDFTGSIDDLTKSLKDGDSFGIVFYAPLRENFTNDNFNSAAIYYFSYTVSDGLAVAAPYDEQKDGGDWIVGDSEPAANLPTLEGYDQWSAPVFSVGGASKTKAEILALAAGTSFTVSYTAPVASGYKGSPAKLAISYSLKKRAQAYAQTVSAPVVWVAGTPKPTVTLPTLPAGYGSFDAGVIKVGSVTKTLAELAQLPVNSTFTVVYTAPLANGYLGSPATYTVTYKIQKNAPAYTGATSSNGGVYDLTNPPSAPTLPTLPAEGYDAFGPGVITSNGQVVTDLSDLNNGATFEVTYTANVADGYIGTPVTYTVTYTLSKVKDAAAYSGSAARDWIAGDQPGSIPAAPTGYQAWGSPVYKVGNEEKTVAQIEALPAGTTFTATYSAAVAQGYQGNPATYTITYTLKKRAGAYAGATTIDGGLWVRTNQGLGEVTSIDPAVQLPEGYGDWSDVVYTRLEDGTSIGGSSFLGLPAGTKFLVVKTARVAPNYIGPDIVVTTEYTLARGRVSDYSQSSSSGEIVSAQTAGSQNSLEFDASSYSLPTLPEGYSSWGTPYFADEQGNVLTNDQVAGTSTTPAGGTFRLVFKAEFADGYVHDDISPRTHIVNVTVKVRLASVPALTGVGSANIPFAKQGVTKEQVQNVLPSLPAAPYGYGSWGAPRFYNSANKELFVAGAPILKDGVITVRYAASAAAGYIGKGDATFTVKVTVDPTTDILVAPTTTWGNASNSVDSYILWNLDTSPLPPTDELPSLPVAYSGYGNIVSYQAGLNTGANARQTLTLAQIQGMDEFSDEARIVVTYVLNFKDGYDSTTDASSYVKVVYKPTRTSTKVAFDGYASYGWGVVAQGVVPNEDISDPVYANDSRTYLSIDTGKIISIAEVKQLPVGSHFAVVWRVGGLNPGTYSIKYDYYEVGPADTTTLGDYMNAPASITGYIPNITATASIMEGSSWNNFRQLLQRYPVAKGYGQWKLKGLAENVIGEVFVQSLFNLGSTQPKFGKAAWIKESDLWNLQVGTVAAFTFTSARDNTVAHDALDQPLLTLTVYVNITPRFSNVQHRIVSKGLEIAQANLNAAFVTDSLAPNYNPLVGKWTLEDPQGEIIEITALPDDVNTTFFVGQKLTIAQAASLPKGAQFAITYRADNGTFAGGDGDARGDADAGYKYYVYGTFYVTVV